jgi:DNA-binding transcriptional MocR family regulator
MSALVLGELLATAGLTDAIDATVALLAGPGDRLYTSDPEDLRMLCGAAGNKAAVLGC